MDADTAAKLDDYMKPYRVVSKVCKFGGIQVSDGGSYAVRWCMRAAMYLFLTLQVCNLVFNFHSSTAPRNALYICSCFHSSCYLLLESGDVNFQNIAKLASDSFVKTTELHRAFHFSHDLLNDVKKEQKMAWRMFVIMCVIMFSTSTLLLYSVFFKG